MARDTSYAEDFFLRIVETIRTGTQEVYWMNEHTNENMPTEDLRMALTYCEQKLKASVNEYERIIPDTDIQKVIYISGKNVLRCCLAFVVFSNDILGSYLDEQALSDEEYESQDEKMDIHWNSMHDSFYSFYNASLTFLKESSIEHVGLQAVWPK